MNRWLVLDDNAIDRRTLGDGIKDLGDEVYPASSFAKAREILKTTPIDICLFDFYFDKEKKITTAKLIADLRESMPRKPIIITSSASDADNILPCLMAGADLFVPKQKSSIEIADTLKVAAITAKLRREIHIQSTALPISSRRLFITQKTQRLYNHIISQVYGNIVICGDTGTGKSSLAKMIAYDIMKEHPERFANYHIFDCASYSEEELMHEFFGRKSKEESWMLDIFDKGRNGTVIVENIQRLPITVQQDLRRIFETRFYRAKGREISLKQIKFIFTYVKEDKKNLVSSFLGKISDYTISLPRVSELHNELENLINFLVDAEVSTNHLPQIFLDEEYMTGMVNYIKSEGVPANFVSLQNILKESVVLARSEARHVLYLRDLNIPTVAKKIQESNSGDYALDTQMKSLTRLLESGQDYKNAKNLVRDIMLASAIKKVGSDAPALSNRLGLSRAQLYKLGYKSQNAQEGIHAV